MKLVAGLPPFASRHQAWLSGSGQLAARRKVSNFPCKWSPHL